MNKYSRFTFDENIFSNLQFIRLFCSNSISKCSSFKNPFATTLSELLFRCRRFILLMQTKKWFLWAIAEAQTIQKHGGEQCWTWYLQWRITTSIPTWTDSQNSIATAETQSWKTSSHGTSLKLLRPSRPSQSAQKYSHKLCNEKGWWKWRQHHDKDFLKERKPL